MNNQIHRYAGYWMRSYTETRWASVMDALGIEWLYEPTLIKTRHGWYLPDFYLPHAGIYVEVKGPEPTQEEIEKGFDLQEATGCPVIFAWGDMQIGIERIEGGFLTSLRSFGVARFSLFEISPIIQMAVPKSQFMRFLRCGLKGEAPCVVSMADALDTVFLDMSGRPGAEKIRAARHKPLNKIKTDKHRQASLSEWALSTFMRRSPGPGVRDQEIAA